MNPEKNTTVETPLNATEQAWLKLAKQAARRSPSSHIIDHLILKNILQKHVPTVYQQSVAPVKPKRTYKKRESVPKPTIQK